MVRVNFWCTSAQHVAETEYLALTNLVLSSNAMLNTPPWGFYKKLRHQCAPLLKLATLVLIVHYMAEDGVCLTEAARRANISHKNIEKRSKLTTKFKELWGGNSWKKSSGIGPDSQLEPIKDDLLLYIFEQRDTGMVVDHLLMLSKAMSLSSSFCAKSMMHR